jgi:hypothetical protein
VIGECRCFDPAHATRGGLAEMKGDCDIGIPGMRLGTRSLPRFGPSKGGKDLLLLICIYFAVGLQGVTAGEVLTRRMRWSVCGDCYGLRV